MKANESTIFSQQTFLLLLGAGVGAGWGGEDTTCLSTQGFVLEKQALYHLSHASSPQILLIIKYYLVKFRDWY
jgi:hypothetical protein